MITMKLSPREEKLLEYALSMSDRMIGVDVDKNAEDSEMLLEMCADQEEEICNLILFGGNE